MLLEFLPAMPECLDDFLAWEPKDYREHFAASHFSNRDAVIAAYEAADPELQPVARYAGRPHEYAAAGDPRSDRGQSGTPEVATPSRAEPRRVLKPIVTRAAALINGTAPGLSRP